MSTTGSGSGRTLTGLFQTSDSMVPMVLDDLTEEQARARPRGEGGPSIAWSILHLLSCRGIMLRHCGVERDDPWAGYLQEPADDGSGYPSVRELISEWADLSEVFISTVSGLTEEALDTEVEDGWQPGQTLRELIGFLTWHEAYHMGAIGQIRKRLGLPGPAERMMAARTEASE